MKKVSIFISALSLFAFCGRGNAQNIQAAAQVDNYITELIPVNSSHCGMAIAPGSMNIKAIAYESGSTIDIKWYDGSGNLMNTYSIQDAGKPDVAYSINADRCFVAYQSSNGHANIAMFHLNMSPFSYVYDLSLDLGLGKWPKINISSQNRGMLVFQGNPNPDIYLTTFDPWAFSLPNTNTVLLDAGYTPDLVVHDVDPMSGADPKVSVVYCEYNNSLIGQLRIRTMMYADVKYGPLPTFTTNVNEYDFNASNMKYHEPRIEAPRHQGAVGNNALKNFTVVAMAEQTSPTSQFDIAGFYYDINTMTIPSQVHLNAGIDYDGCANIYPVVDYQFGTVRASWVSSYEDCLTTLTTTTGYSPHDVISVETDMTGTAITNGYYEINDGQAVGFYGGDNRIASAVKYDASYPVTNQTFLGASYFTNGVDKFWKEINNSNPQYRQASNSIVKEVKFQVFQKETMEPIFIQYENIAACTFSLFDASGREMEIQIEAVSNDMAQLSLNHLSVGTYILKCDSGKESESFKIIR